MPETILLAAFRNLTGIKAGSVSFRQMYSPYQISLFQLTYFDTVLFCNFLDFFKLHFNSPCG